MCFDVAKRAVAKFLLLLFCVCVWGFFSIHFLRVLLFEKNIVAWLPYESFLRIPGAGSAARTLKSVYQKRQQF